MEMLLIKKQSDFGFSNVCAYLMRVSDKISSPTFESETRSRKAIAVAIVSQEKTIFGSKVTTLAHLTDDGDIASDY